MTAATLTVGTEIQVRGVNIWGENDDLGRPGHITLVDVVGDYAVQFDDDIAPRGSWFAREQLKVRQ